MNRDGYDFKLDSNITHNNKYAIAISRKTGADFGALSYVVPGAFNGHRLTLKGFMKTESVSGGFAGFWVRVDGTSAFNNMGNQNIKGTTDWREYTINLRYDEDNALNINVGALLTGSGKMWIDDLRLYIDGEPIDKAVTKKPFTAPA